LTISSAAALPSSSMISWIFISANPFIIFFMSSPRCLERP
jgi:hypothetical protein